jgi:hypothetical protein
MTLEDEQDLAARTAFEWGHVTFFPNLLIQSVSDSLSAAPEKKGK